ncbi:DMT family transporter [Sabulilitoribacter arenilitoris]|uniref:DMT family transporter n=1 Tax=Wocania arenilitoris TaxID=2044858 RepID=A0AAE3EL15_9FLAO|nr:DMT family transporter [Wocania arenilitoris]MCF7566988.1 DMT family transporter [Wocania arenilitoris]
MNNVNLKWIYLFTLSLIWGSSFILMKKVLIGLTAVQLGSLRIIFSGFFLFIVGFNKIKTITSKDWKWVGLTGLLGTFFPVFFFAYAQTEIDSSIASILNSLVPLNTVLVGFLVFKIVSTKRQILGVFIGLLGTVMLIVNGASIHSNQNYLYVIFIILATLSYATSVNVLKRYLQNMHALTIAVGNFAVIIIPAVIILISSGFFKTEVLVSPSLKPALLYLLILSLFGTAMAKVLFNKLVYVATPVFASSVTYLMPIVAIFWGILDDESLTLLQVFAGLIILLGVYLVHKRKG